jgi:hypothetical protein
MKKVLWFVFSPVMTTSFDWICQLSAIPTSSLDLPVASRNATKNQDANAQNNLWTTIYLSTPTIGS